jgi:3-methyladenine DNA glycosylase AlkD
VEFYVRNLKKVNNWDLVDTSASYILGSWLLYRPRAILFKLAKSNNLWEKRVAIVSTFAFISKGQIEDTFKITKMLMHDPHDLIHKACGWMLREAGKQSQKELEKFLDLHAKYMPRTMLRYAIERFSSQKRLKYRSKH